MAKGEARGINKLNNQLQRDTKSKYGQLYGGMADRLPGAIQRGDQAYNDTYGGLKDFLSGAGRHGGPGSIGDWEGRFKKFSDNPLEGVDVGRVRGNGVFDEFAKTGGVSDADKQALRERTTGNMQAIYGGLRDELDRGARSTGFGGGPGFDAQMAKLTREQAQASGQALNEGEIGLADLIRQGRQWGAGNVSSADEFLGNLYSQNKLAGLEGGLKASGMGAEFGANYDKDTLAALNEMRGLRTDQPGEEFGLYDRLGENVNSEMGMRRGLQQDRMQYNPNLSLAQQVGQWTNAAAPIIEAAAGAYGGGGGGAGAASGVFGGGGDSFGGGVSRFTGTGNRVQMPTGGIRPRRTMSAPRF